MDGDGVVLFPDIKMEPEHEFIQNIPQFLFIIQIIEEQDELVAAVPPHKPVILLLKFPQDIADAFQRPVADSVPIGVIQGFQVVQINEAERKQPVAFDVL